MIECATMKMLRILFMAVLLGGSVATTTQAQDVAGDLLGRINALRASLGLPGYTLNGALSAAAANQAQWMAATGQISHTQSDGSTPSSRAAAAGYGGSWVSENIYAGSHAGVGDAWGFWLNSPIHYRGMTNPNYQEIGIASATGDRGRAFVLVFGRVGGNPIVAARPGAGGSGSAASAPPSFVVGLDNFGNIMHEVQPEQTIGDILLTYGYTWEDMPEFLTLNHKTDEDIRRLQIGEIVLVPPYGGTYTPTPLPEGWPTNTPEPEDFVATAIAEAAAEATAAALTPTLEIVPTDTPDSVPVEATSEAEPDGEATPETEGRQSNGRIATSAAVPSFLSGGPTPTPDAESVTLLDGVTLTPPPIPTEDVTAVESVTPDEGVTLTPSVTPTPTPTLDDVSALETQFAPTLDVGATVVASVNQQPAQFQDVMAVTPPGESPWLFIAILLQITIIVGAGYMYVRGGKRR